VINEIKSSREGSQAILDIWCEEELTSGQYVRCWPQYQGNKGSWYDWAMAKFESDENKEPMVYPGKVLALYKDVDSNVKALIHSTDYKTSR
jgi:L-fucose isomerase-like protein